MVRTSQQLTNDKFGDLQPQWSPDGRTIAFASDRDSASFANLYFKPWRITLLDLASGTTSVLPGQAGLNINPQWAPDGRSIAYVSDRTGTANSLPVRSGRARALPAHERRRRDLGAHRIQSRNHLGATGGSIGVHVLRECSIHDLDGEQSAAGCERHHIGSLRRSQSWLLLRPTTRSTERSPIVALLDSFDLGLPDTTKFRVNRYRVRLQPDYVTRPSIGYVPDAFGRSVFGGTTVVLGDMLGSNHLAISGEVNGRASEAQVFLGYTNLSKRWQYSTALSQAPYYFLSSDSLSNTLDPGVALENQEITTYAGARHSASPPTH